MSSCYTKDMPAKESAINLIEKDPLEASAIGRIVSWATTYGRYIMITTEIVVLIAFVSRFSLDRQLTDLNEQINQKQAILEANTQFENDFLKLQDELSKIKTLISTNTKPADTLTLIHLLLPADVQLQTITLSDTNIKVTGAAGSSGGLAVFLDRLRLSKSLSNVSVGDIVQAPGQGLQFQFGADYIVKPLPKPVPVANAAGTTSH
jgi:Tfp pilus assembly protein PilN